MSILLNFVYLFLNIICFLILFDDVYECMNVLSCLDVKFFMWNYFNSDMNCSLYILCCLAIMCLHLLYLPTKIIHKCQVSSYDFNALLYLGQHLSTIDNYILCWIQLNCEAISLLSISKSPCLSTLLMTFLFHATILIIFIWFLNWPNVQPKCIVHSIYYCVLIMFFHNINLGLCLLHCILHGKHLYFYALLGYQLFSDPRSYLFISYFYMQGAKASSYLLKTYCTHSILMCKNKPFTFTLLNFLLLQCGDVEANPGPNQQHTPTGTKIQFANIRGLWANFLALRACIDNTVDVLCLSETFLSNSRSDNDITIPGFQKPIRNDRPAFGGGSIVYVSDALYAKRKPLLESTDIEIIATELNTGRNKILLYVAYRPPSDPIDYDFWNSLQTCIDEGRNANYPYFILTGDLNADPNTPNGGYLKHFCLSNGLTIHIDEPTRIVKACWHNRDI